MLDFSYPDFTPKFVEIEHLSGDGLFMSERGSMADLLLLKIEITHLMSNPPFDSEALTDKFNQFLILTVRLSFFVPRQYLTKIPSGYLCADCTPSLYHL
jgi:hypothetical protein